jgi:hypothetical protein
MLRFSPRFSKMVRRLNNPYERTYTALAVEPTTDSKLKLLRLFRIYGTMIVGSISRTSLRHMVGVQLRCGISKNTGRSRLGRTYSISKSQPYRKSITLSDKRIGTVPQHTAARRRAATKTANRHMIGNCPGVYCLLHRNFPEHRNHLSWTKRQKL